MALQFLKGVQYALVVACPQGVTDEQCASELENAAGFTTAKAVKEKLGNVDGAALRQQFSPQLDAQHRAVVVVATWHRPTEVIQEAFVGRFAAYQIVAMQPQATDLKNWAWAAPLAITIAAVGIGAAVLRRLGGGERYAA